MINRFATARKFASKIVETKKLIPPIDPIEVIRSYNIEITEEENQLGIEAYSSLDEVPKITINTEFSLPSRKRFTLAHELGHIIIPWHNGDLKCDTDKPYNIIRGRQLLDTQELEANIFASELLMPQVWLQEQISSLTLSFEDTINTIRDKAQTSIMACLYALEDALPSGNLYYVKKDNTDYWKKFSSERTCTTEIYGKIEDKITFLNRISNSQEIFHISQYEIIYFSLLGCPNSQDIKNIYAESNDIIECINIISVYNPLKIILFLKDILNSLDDVYCCHIFENEKHLRCVTHLDSKLYTYCQDYNVLIETLEKNDLDYYEIKSEEYKLVFIKEEMIDLIDVSTTNPNTLLKSIVQDIYPDNFTKMLQSINGVVANINSKKKSADLKLLYNIVRLRFAGDYNMIDFFNHSDFDTYVINKIKSMLQNQKNNT